MSTHPTLQKNSLAWSEILIVVFGLAAVAAFTGVGVAGVITLNQALPATASKAYWFISRSSGVLAYVLLSLAVIWGLVQSGGILRPSVPPALAFGLHSFLSWTSLALVALHGLILLGDSYIKLTLADVIIPFIGPYHPTLVGLGVLSFYLMFLLALSFYLRNHLGGQKTFRTLHYLSFLIYLLATWHSLAIGTDSAWLWPLYLVSFGAVSLLTLWRVVNTHRSVSTPRRSVKITQTANKARSH
jgi:predicted ferric reductase